MFLALPVRLLDMEIVKQGVYFYIQTAADMEIVKQGVYFYIQTAADMEIVKQGVYILYTDCWTWRL